METEIILVYEDVEHSLRTEITICIPRETIDLILGLKNVATQPESQSPKENRRAHLTF